jgi:hypothetical protein
MKLILLTILITVSSFSFSQKDYAKIILDTLCSTRYAGRGYVDDGVEKAGVFLENELKSWGVKPFPNQPYQQKYSFGVNTFPYDISIKLDDKELVIGQDYLVDAMSGSAQGKFEVIEVNSKNYLQYKDNLNQAGKIIVYNFTDLNNRDSILFFKKFAYKTLEYTPAVWINKNKMMYTVGRRAFKYPLIQLDEKVYHSPKTITLKVNNKYIPNYTSSNVIGYIPSNRKCKIIPEKYIVLSAHYDHLGKMGQAIFPGANDNASGVAMVLSLAKYFQVHRLKYGIVLCLFSGEEAGLEGSKYFVSHPYFKLKKVKFVLNIDIMGGAETGITVVNATKFPKEFETLSNINKQKQYLNKVNKRGESANSDHYFFSQMNVPAFFIYSVGEVKNYHDINDKSENTPLNKFNEVEQLLIDFIEQL